MRNLIIKISAHLFNKYLATHYKNRKTITIELQKHIQILQ